MGLTPTIGDILQCDCGAVIDNPTAYDYTCAGTYKLAYPAHPDNPTWLEDEDWINIEGTTFPEVGIYLPRYCPHCGAPTDIAQLVQDYPELALWFYDTDKGKPSCQ